MFWKPTLAIQADVASVIVELAQKVDLKMNEDWLPTLRARDSAKEQANEWVECSWGRGVRTSS